MKAIILAAGKGTRLWKYAKGIPKCALNFQGKTLLERQIGTLRAGGIHDIVVVKGYKAESINFPGIRYYLNPDYENTNMVHTLFCAEKEFCGDVIIAYADILYESKVLRQIIDEKGDIAIAIDTNWKKYWKLRYGNTDTDTESMVLGKNDRVLELGEINPKKDKIDGRYVGLIKFSSKGSENAKIAYNELKLKYWNRPWPKDKPFQEAYMTDFLNHLIMVGRSIKAVKIKNGWLEFDTNEDYEKIVQLEKDHKLEELFNVSS